MRKPGRFVFLGLVASLVTLLGVTTPARGGGLTDGLAVAVTADGARLVAGGSNRVLYELDPTTLEVKRRVWLGRQIMHMLFSPDGKVLVVESTAAVQWLKADTLEPFATKKDARGIQPVPALGAVAMVIPDYTKPAVRLFDFADASEKAHGLGSTVWSPGAIGRIHCSNPGPMSTSCVATIPPPNHVSECR